MNIGRSEESRLTEENVIHTLKLMKGLGSCFSEFCEDLRACGPTDGCLLKASIGYSTRVNTAISDLLGSFTTPEGFNKKPQSGTLLRQLLNSQMILQITEVIHLHQEMDLQNIAVKLVSWLITHVSLTSSDEAVRRCKEILDIFVDFDTLPAQPKAEIRRLLTRLFGLYNWQSFVYVCKQVAPNDSLVKEFVELMVESCGGVLDNEKIFKGGSHVKFTNRLRDKTKSSKIETVLKPGHYLRSVIGLLTGDTTHKDAALREMTENFWVEHFLLSLLWQDWSEVGKVISRDEIRPADSIGLLFQWWLLQGHNKLVEEEPLPELRVISRYLGNDIEKFVKEIEEEAATFGPWLFPHLHSLLVFTHNLPKTVLFRSLSKYQDFIVHIKGLAVSLSIADESVFNSIQDLYLTEAKFDSENIEFEISKEIQRTSSFKTLHDWLNWESVIARLTENHWVPEIKETVFRAKLQILQKSSDVSIHENQYETAIKFALIAADVRYAGNPSDPLRFALLEEILFRCTKQCPEIILDVFAKSFGKMGIIDSTSLPLAFSLLWSYYEPTWTTMRKFEKKNSEEIKSILEKSYPHFRNAAFWCLWVSLFAVNFFDSAASKIEATLMAIINCPFPLLSFQDLVMAGTSRKFMNSTELSSKRMKKLFTSPDEDTFYKPWLPYQKQNDSQTEISSQWLCHETVLSVASFLCV